MKLIKPDLINRWQWGRKPRLGACSMLAAASVLSAASTFAQVEKFDIDLNYRLLENALIELSRQTGAGVFAAGEKVKAIQVTPLSGNMSVEEALEKLLQGTGLKYDKNDDGSYIIQESPESSSPSSKEQTRRGVEEVIVTARKREESVQDIPIAISAFSAEDLRNAGIRNLSDMEGIVPGLNMGGGGNGVKKDSNPFIRGVGQRETKVTLDPAVGTYIDGIYLARTQGSLIDTVGVESVEVLRGPQGTLFGKNTTGGAINITTKKPHQDFGASVDVTVGNYGRSDAVVMINGPLVEEQLLGRLTIGAKNSDGYFTNVVDNTKWGDDNRITAIGQLRWYANNDLMFDFLAERTKVRETPRPQKCKFARDDGFYSQIVESTDFRRMANGNPTFGELCAESESLPDNKFSSDFSKNSEGIGKQGRYWVDTATLGLTGTWDIGDLGAVNNAQIKSISSWRKVDLIADEDLDGVGAEYLLRVQPSFTETTQMSQEFQFTGSTLDDRLFFSTGLYYFEEETPKDDIIRAAGYAWAPNQNGNDFIVSANEPTLERLETDNSSLAWYGQLDFNITEQLKLTAGLRYTEEKRSSTYSKAYAKQSSLGYGNRTVSLPYFYEFDGCPTACNFRNDMPGMTSVFDWDFISFASDSLSTNDRAWTPLLSLQYVLGDLSEQFGLDDAMAYITYSEGFHAGGVTAGAVDDEAEDVTFEFGSDGSVTLARTSPGAGAEDPITFDPEKVKNYEVGLKLQAIDKRVQANMAVFYMDYTDMQVTSTANRAGLPIPFVENVGSSVISGFEGEFIFLPTNNWRILANASYTNADMKEWEAQKLILNAFDGSVSEIASETRDDEPLPRVPRWQAYFMSDYTIPFSDGSLITPSVSARYVSEVYHGFDRGSFLYGKDTVTSDPVTMVDARVTYLSPDQRFEIALWGKNLTNKTDYLVGGIPLVDVTGAMGQVYANPRTFGLEMTYRFGAE
ncbi:TonB-dependent receptor domain-containing protein [Zhongshania aquimaris]|uniref:TonB-dependent receptor n=1 Tax=Zhongshania aquimaris TaxID=2857107 RepID=A0ABS6VV00_9GAMM|nr:TonB-dependent receptor [Zhongshania aquimaris]MBW2942165.1 TonB-dependent receptor [Zhongshania aquimaris]